MQHPVPPEAWEKLGLAVWEHPRLELANQCQSAVAALSLSVAHPWDLDRLPEADEQGTWLLRDYVAEQSVRISGALQQASDLVTEVAGYFDRITPEEHGECPALVAAMQLVPEVWGNVRPSEGFEGKTEMDLTIGKEWMGRLALAIVQAELVRLCWAAGALGLRTEEWSSAARRRPPVGSGGHGAVRGVMFRFSWYEKAGRAWEGLRCVTLCPNMGIRWSNGFGRS